MSVLLYQVTFPLSDMNNHAVRKRYAHLDVTNESRALFVNDLFTLDLNLKLAKGDAAHTPIESCRVHSLYDDETIIEFLIVIVETPNKSIKHDVDVFGASCKYFGRFKFLDMHNDEKSEPEEHVYKVPMIEPRDYERICYVRAKSPEEAKMKAENGYYVQVVDNGKLLERKQPYVPDLRDIEISSQHELEDAVRLMRQRIRGAMGK